MPLKICDERPYPALIFRAVLGEQTTGASRSLSKMRWCTVDTLNGLGEMVQSIVSTDDAALYVAFQESGSLLTIHLHPNDKIYIIDLQKLGGADALDLRQTFNTAQLHATATNTSPDEGAITAEDNDPARQQEPTLLDIGHLPSLRGLLESPSITKVIFDTTETVPALHEAYGVALYGVRDIQLMDIAGQPVRTFFHRKQVTRHGAVSRNLRCCLE